MTVLRRWAIVMMIALVNSSRMVFWIFFYIEIYQMRAEQGLQKTNILDRRDLNQFVMLLRPL